MRKESYHMDLDRFLVYKRKMKRSSDEEESKSSPDNVSILESSKISEARDEVLANNNNNNNALVTFEKSSGKEYCHGGASASSYAKVGSTMLQNTPQELQRDKILMLRETLWKSIEERERLIQINNIEASYTMRNPYQAYTQAGRAHKEKYDKLRARQKRKLSMRRNTVKSTLSSSRLVGPKHSSHLHQIFKWNNAPAPAAQQYSSLKSSLSLKGKEIAIPKNTTSLHKMKSSSLGQSMTLEPATSFRRPPYGVLKLKSWTETELDALWIGVRRHGVGNWESILEDPFLRSSLRTKIPQDLNMRWNKEVLNMNMNMNMISPPPPPSSSSSLNCGVSLSLSLSPPDYQPASEIAPPPPPKPKPQVIRPFNLNLDPMVADLIYLNDMNNAYDEEDDQGSEESERTLSD